MPIALIDRIRLSGWYTRLRRQFLLAGSGLNSPGSSASMALTLQTLQGIAFYQATFDLTDPDTLIHVGLANGAPYANSPQRFYGDEGFSRMVSRLKAAIVVNGTFFNTHAVHHELMGNLVSAAKMRRYRSWETRGTTFSLRRGNQPELLTPRLQTQQRDWDQYWLSITSGPRLLQRGEVCFSCDRARAEGFSEAHLIDPNIAKPRSAIGYSQMGTRLFIVAFIDPVSLKQAAAVMQAIGAAEAMNLDGGSSVALAHRTRVVYPAGRKLTNVIAVYDAANPAPAALQEAWTQFQRRPPALYG